MIGIALVSIENYLMTFPLYIDWHRHSPSILHGYMVMLHFF
jgi:hypothetical protein